MMRRSPSFDDFEFEDFFGRMSRQLEEMSRQFESSRGMGRGVAVDLREDEDSYIAIVDLPGYEKSDIDLSVMDEVLTIEALRSESVEHDSDSYVHRERRADSIHRSVRLPSAIRPDDASATYNNGVLTVTLPKLQIDEDEDSHHIDVE